MTTITKPRTDELTQQPRRVNGDHRRWCSICGTQRSTTRGMFDQHQKPDGKSCPNSGQRVNKTEQVG